MYSFRKVPKFFLSLKWKTMSLLGLVLLSIMIILISWSYVSQTSRFEKEREFVNTRYLEQVKAMLDDFSLKISQVSSLVATMISIDDTLFTSGTLSWPGAKSRVDVAWAALQVDYGLDSLRIYNAENDLVAKWGGSESPSDLEFRQVKASIRREVSVAWVDCTHICQQYAATPILTNSDVAGLVVVSANMADLILTFNRITNANIGFILNSVAEDSKNALPKLGMHVAGLSNADVNIPLLQKLESVSLTKGKTSWQRLQLGQQHHELAFLPLDDGMGHLQAMIVVIDNVTASVHYIQDYLSERLEIGSVLSLFAMLVMYLLLNAPLRRVTNAVQAIPFIGKHDFDAARTQIHIRDNPIFSDEVDSLAEAAWQLTNQLEVLEQDADRHQSEMLDMLRRISQASEFSERILDTAQVVIITQDKDGTVTSINHYGEQLLGWSKDHLRNKLLREVFKSKEAGNQLKKIFRSIISQGLDHYYHECTMVCNKGVEREIAWHHSRMDGEVVQILSVGVEITLRKKSEEKSLYLAEHDQLTGLINRQCFMREVENVILRIRGTNEQYTLLYLDLDGFKYINDISGHQAGDIVLRMVAEALSKLCRRDDILARLGGDEMGILLSDCDVENAIKVAEKINHQFGEMRYPGLVGEHHISSSIGIVSVTEANQDVRHLLANADIAMYQAKSMGKARWYVFSEGERLQEKLEQRVLWEDRIKQALRDERFVMHYQPILDIHKNTISHYEALVRMQGDNGNLIPPVEFIEVAEKSGFINELDQYIVRTVINRWAALMAEGKQCKVAINLSGLSMNDESLLQLLQDLFMQYPDLPSQVIFEITETAAVADFSLAREFIETVRAMGCAFSLDDFGVGFSSFYYLKHLPVDYVKIDGSFIRNLADSPDDQIFVRALAEVARGFGKLTVAEFVGDERSLALLRSYGVDYAQGYFVGKPSADIL
jgi:diguanylate cyclase (GGDEF)-like protein/PAS domain S-box-containing protein